MSDLTSLGLPIGLTMALVELVKQVDIEGRLNRFYPLLSLTIGLLLGLLLTHLSVLESLVVGLAASGVYRGVKVTVLGN